MNREWAPNGAQLLRGNPGVNAFVALDHRVWRVLEIRPKPRADWDDEALRVVSNWGDAAAPANVVLRPARTTGDDPQLRSQDRHFRAYGTRTHWWVYPHDHYPVCGTCGEPTPCRERTAIEESERAAKHMVRYEVAGVCPACQQPVTGRQGSRTFDENLYMPGGPPVTFHAGRRECYSGMVSYEETWVAADPEHRRPRYRCDGVLTVHSARAYECTQGARCPGPHAAHRARLGCGCPDHDNVVVQLTGDAVNLTGQGGES